MGLNERQKKAVEYAKEKNRVPNMEYQEINKISKPTATRELKELVEKKRFIRYGGTGKGTYYVLFERAHKGLKSKNSTERIVLKKNEKRTKRNGIYEQQEII